MSGTVPRYEASPKHCPPYSGIQGTRCPEFSRTIAQRLLDESVTSADARFATAHGIAFVALRTHPGTRDVWHGYPEAWDRIPERIEQRWLAEGRVRHQDLRRWRTRADVASAWRQGI